MSTILVADDEADLRDLMAVVLESAGHDVITARDGVHAIAQSAAHQIDLVVLDVMMPRATGVEVLGEIRARSGSQPAVLMLSALCSRADIRAGYIAGADDYIAKPFSMQEFVDRVHTLLDERAVLA
ncbi:MAG: response regulator [Actinobacteria bacterium]|uniref:Unannotated protein n=1 Tax=freshwater metagenome TaxID=449393 RepID=A0A6J6NYM8_9ZZZZ|nr:response regulator [Actinomycetota bacterium]